MLVWNFTGERRPLLRRSPAISNRIVAYVADAPEGPWGEPYVVHDMGNAAFRDNYCCAVEDNCLGEQMFNCARTGFYGTYLLPEVIETSRMDSLPGKRRIMRATS